MLRTAARPRAGDRERGFTLLELMVVLAVMAVVLVVAGGALFSLSQTANRHGVMVTDEQTASTALAQMATDIRSAHSFSIPPGIDPTTEVILQVNNPGGGTTPVEWVYNQPASTLTREVLNNDSSVKYARTVVTQVGNGRTVPLFTYYNYHGDNVSNADNTTIGNCTTRIGVQLIVSPGLAGVSSFKATDDVALSDQLGLLSAPGNGQC
jgi:prepilin-type N-terminal cleavage/methylation domain-containing protein